MTIGPRVLQVKDGPASGYPLDVRGCGEGGVVGAGGEDRECGRRRLDTARDRVTAVPLRPDAGREMRWAAVRMEG
jgi:hypothetical protein